MAVRLSLASLLAAFALCALLASSGRAANECNGIQRCVPVSGPWVVVPASGEVDFLLECPGAKGIVGGTDALVSSQQIGVSWDAIPGSPIGSGRTSNFEVLFRAVSGNHRPGEFQPFIGCIPTQSSTRTTTAVPSHPLGAPLDLRAANVAVDPGQASSGSLRCPVGEQFVDSWTATAFALPEPAPPGSAAAITVHATVSDGVASLSARAGASLSLSVHALVQLGVRCQTT